MKRRMWIAVALVALTTAALCMVSFADCLYSGEDCFGLPLCGPFEDRYCREVWVCPPDYQPVVELCGCC